VLVVVTDGELVCVDGGAPDPVLTTCLPVVLVEALVSEPRWLDLRWAREDTQLDLRNGRFREAIADLAAPVHGVPKEDLASEDVRLQRRTVRLVRVAVGLVTVLAVLAAVTAVIAVRRGNEASEQRDLAQTNAATAQENATKAADKAAEASYQALVARSAALTDTDRSAAMLLAVEANKRRPNTMDSTGALFTSLTADPNFVGYLRSDTQPFTAVVVDSEHDLVIAGTVDGKVVRWRLSDRQQIGEQIQIGDTDGAGDQTLRLAVGGGLLVAVRNASGGGGVFSETSGQLLASIDPVGGVESLAVNEDGSVFAIGGVDGRLEVRSTPDASIVAALSPTGIPRTVAFAPDDVVVAADETGSIGSYRTTDLARVGTQIQAISDQGSCGFDTGYCHSVGLAVSGDGSQLWWWNSDVVQRFDRTTGSELWSTKERRALDFGFVGGGAVDTATGRVFMAAKGAVVSWTGSLRSGIESDRTYDLQQGGVTGVSVDHKMLAVAGADRSVIAVWGIDGRSAIATAYPVGDEAHPTNFSPNGDGLLVTSFGVPQRIDLSSRQLGPQLDLSSWAFLMSSDEVVGAETNTGNTKTSNAATGAAAVSPVPNSDLRGATVFAVDVAGEQVAVASFDVVVLDRSGKEVRRVGLTSPEAAAVLSLAFSPDGKWLAIGTSSQAEVFDIAANKRVVALPGHADTVAFTPDGRELIVGDQFASAKRYLTEGWAATGQPIAYSKNGALALRARADGVAVAIANELHLSDIASGAPIGRELKIATWVDSTISADGLKVATKNSTHTGVVVWDLNPADWPVAACLAAGRNLTKAEWVASFGDEPYRVTCEGWPANG
jgi:WD40 repeat protein